MPRKHTGQPQAHAGATDAVSVRLLLQIMASVARRGASGGDDGNEDRRRKMPKNDSTKIIFEHDDENVQLLMRLLLAGAAGSIINLKYNPDKHEEGAEEWEMPYSAIMPASEDKLSRWITNLLNPPVQKRKLTGNLAAMLTELRTEFTHANLMRLVFAALQAVAKKKQEDKDDADAADDFYNP